MKEYKLPSEEKAQTKSEATQLNEDDILDEGWVMVGKTEREAGISMGSPKDTKPQQEEDTRVMLETCKRLAEESDARLQQAEQRIQAKRERKQKKKPPKKVKKRVTWAPDVPPDKEDEPALYEFQPIVVSPKKLTASQKRNMRKKKAKEKAKIFNDRKKKEEEMMGAAWRREKQEEAAGGVDVEESRDSSSKEVNGGEVGQLMGTPDSTKKEGEGNHNRDTNVKQQTEDTALRKTHCTSSPTARSPTKRQPHHASPESSPKPTKPKPRPNQHTPPMNSSPLADSRQKSGPAANAWARPGDFLERYKSLQPAEKTNQRSSDALILGEMPSDVTREFHRYLTVPDLLSLALTNHAMYR